MELLSKPQCKPGHAVQEPRMGRLLRHHGTEAPGHSHALLSFIVKTDGTQKCHPQAPSASKHQRKNASSQGKGATGQNGTEASLIRPCPYLLLFLSWAPQGPALNVPICAGSLLPGSFAHAALLLDHSSYPSSHPLI